MIDASATAVVRGPIATNGSKNLGSQDAADAQEDGVGFGDYLEEAAAESADAETTADDEASSAGAADAGDGVRARSIMALFTIAAADGKAGQQGQIDPALYRLAQSGAGSSKTVSNGSERLSGSLSGSDRMLSADQIAALASELQGATDAGLTNVAAQDVLKDQTQAGEEELLASLLADVADVATTGGEGASAIHRLLSSLTKELGADDEAGSSSDEETAGEFSDAANSTSILNLAQPLQAANAAQTMDTTGAVDGADAEDLNANSVKDALAQVTTTSTGEVDGALDVSVEGALKSGKDADNLHIDGFDQVTVLDSRRYLGFGGDNAKMLTAALANEAGKALAPYSTVTDPSAQATATTVNTLKIEMNPEHLGTMTASLRLKGEELSVEVTVDTIEGYRHLAKDHSAIVQSLRDQGFTVDQVSIQLNPTPKTDSQQQDQGQYGSNQNLREGQSDAQRQQNGDGRSASRGDGIVVGELQSSDQDSSRDAGSSGDGLYL